MTYRIELFGGLVGRPVTSVTLSNRLTPCTKRTMWASGLRGAAAIMAALALIFLTSAGFSDLANADSTKVSSYHAFQGGGTPAHGAALVRATTTDAPEAALEKYAKQVGLGTVEPSANKEPATPGHVKSAAPAKKPMLLAKAGGGAADATYVGTKTCLGCHAAQAAVFDKTLMGRIGKTQPGTMDCENCHGPGSAHAKAGGGRGVGGIISFRPDDFSRTAKQNNAICLGCHDKGHRVLWNGSTHETRNIACTNCHTVMKNVSRKHQLKKATVLETCSQCHKNKRAQFWRSTHMPVREGKMTCTDCHNPHGSFGQSLLKEASINENCYKCHAEKRGPFLWEHAPVRESCLNCHNPHGSNNDFLLKVSRPRLCQQCHSGGYHPSNPRDPFSVYALNRSCQHCHSRHHGSNSAAGQRFQR